MFLLSCGTTEEQEHISLSNQSHHTERGFKNTDPSYENRTIKDMFRWIVLERGKDAEGMERLHYPVRVAMDGAEQLTSALDRSFSVTWIGHSTMLIRLGGVTILTDPVWSDRASPVSWAGPKRHIPPGIPLEALPSIDVILLSHNHYDHLDLRTLKALGNGPEYLVPLGLGEFLKHEGIGPCREFDWWESVGIGVVTLTCLPAQHFSSRTPFDRDRTLWCSWAANTDSGSFYFGGDSGHFDGYSEIGERLGPFDVAALPIGAYLPRWFMGPVHLSPDDALKAADALRARIMIPIHWGAFNLAADPFDHSPAVLDNLLRNGDGGHERVTFLMPGDTFIPGDS